jgi:hypothetical protein
METAGDKNKCSHCGGVNIGPTTRVASFHGPGSIEYKPAKKRLFQLRLFEPLLAQVCLDCGTVRQFVLNTQRDWG